jgi:hypothetical protein
MDEGSRQDSFIPSFLPEIHVTYKKLSSNPGKNQKHHTQKQPSHLLPPTPPPPKFNPSTD